jgi:DNA/RNA-binding domain of Phe-tRNA-synthetase-like protein
MFAAVTGVEDTQTVYVWACASSPWFLVSQAFQKSLQADKNKRTQSTKASLRRLFRGRELGDALIDSFSLRVLFWFVYPDLKEGNRT